MRRDSLRLYTLLAMTPGCAGARRPAIAPATVIASPAPAPSAPSAPPAAAVEPDAAGPVDAQPAAPRPPVENLTVRWERENLRVDTLLEDGRVVAHNRDEPRAYRFVDARTGHDGAELPWLAGAMEPRSMYGDESVAALGDALVTRTGDTYRRGSWRVALYAVETGDRRWELPTGDVAEPYVVRVAGAQALFVVRPGAPLASVQRLDPATGRPLWSAALPQPEARVVAHRGAALLVFASAAHVPRGMQRSATLLALDPQTGAPRWRRDFQGSGCEDAGVDGDARSIVVGCLDAAHLLDASTGAVEQSVARPTGAPDHERPRTRVALYDDALVVLWGSGSLAGYAREAGMPERWQRRELDGDALVRLDEGALVRAHGRELHWVEPASGRSRWRHQHTGGDFSLLAPVRADAPAEMLGSLGSSAVAFARGPAPAREEVLVVRGRVRVNGVPARGVTVTLGASEARTDSRGGYRVETRVRGHVELAVQPESLARVAPGRPCVVPRGLEETFTHDGSRSERAHDFNARARPYACGHSCDCE